MAFIENIFGTIALITSIIGLLPQIYKSYQTKSTQDVSMVMLGNYLICALSWVVYGIFQGSDFVIWSNVVGTLTSITSICQKLYYDKAI